MKGIKCTVVCNTRWGYIMSPKECKSKSEAKKYANDLGMAYRIFVNGKLTERGWGPKGCY